MVKVRTGALVLLSLLLACKGDEGDEGAGLFGSGGTPPISSATDDGSEGTTAGTTSSPDDDPPPPPPPTSDDESSAGNGPGTDSTDGDPPGTTDDTSDSSDTFNDGTLDVQVTTQSMFPQGQCDDVLVTNVSGMAVTWEVELTLPGTINQLWNAEVVEMAGSGVFTGVAFNATLDPGQQAMFGYCVDY